MAVAAESADQFWQEFNETVALLKSELGALSPESADIAGVLKDVKTRIAQLQSCKIKFDLAFEFSRIPSKSLLSALILFVFVSLFSSVLDATISTIVLPAYDVRRSQEVRSIRIAWAD